MKTKLFQCFNAIKIGFLFEILEMLLDTPLTSFGRGKEFEGKTLRQTTLYFFMLKRS